MIGAGIFVFPGLTAGRAGPAAMLSFAVGAGVALLVALPTSELATAMPESGGGSYFVSRSLGGLVGSVVGLGQWLGLVFASAFYLVGFGYYAADTAHELGLPAGIPVLALGAAGGAAAVGLVVSAVAQALGVFAFAGHLWRRVGAR